MRILFPVPVLVVCPVILRLKVYVQGSRWECNVQSCGVELRNLCSDSTVRARVGALKNSMLFSTM